MTDKNQSKLWVEPMAGLGNRMQVMASAYFFAQKYQKELCILWSNDGDLAADFEDIFEAVPGIRIIKITTAGYHAKPFLRIKSEVLRRKLSLGCSYVTGVDRWPGMSTQEIFATVDEDLRDAESSYIRSWRPFAPLYEDEKITMDFLKPSEAVRQRGKSLFQTVGEHTIGVHIRRMDHVDAIRNSPTDAFFVQMHKELDEDSSCRFFLATDDIGVESKALSEFGERVFCKDNKSWGRKHRDGILDACVDLWTLSKCRKILGSSGSTFGEVAAKLGNIRLEIVTREDRIGGK